ncbi:MAG TPA: phosphatase PAP2 family protein [Steroidobacteraceae bacterium]|nr:phosphatase PAP2 family protein [Steroidobacteraceae bacterium]
MRAAAAGGVRRAAWVLLALLGAGPARAGGPFGIDHELALDERGIWSRKYQEGLEYGTIAFEIGSALWLGNDGKLGHTMWQTLDSSIISGLASEGLKRIFSRARPDQGNNPNAWFRGSCCESFPSGEVTLQASFVTPIIANYARQNPWIWTLEALPVYDGIARMKSHAHWQSDVIAGWALGTGLGYWSTTWSTPLTVRLLPSGVTVGISKRF